MRGEWVGSFCRRVGAGYERFGGGFGRLARGVADVRAYRWTRLIPDADTPAFRGR